MKRNVIKMILVVLIVSIITLVIKEKDKIAVENSVNNNNINFNSYNNYNDIIVYNGLTLEELGTKIDSVFNSTLDGYGKTVATLALDKEVDPVVAASIILVETGCKWNCSSLVKNNNNVGGMRSSKGYLKFSTLEKGLEAFINNLSKNYYTKGLNTPELINKKYASNPNWYKDVYYYVNVINAS